MVQTFRVLQCFSCQVFQVDQVKASTSKWSCKVCHEKQSVKRVFALGSGKDCRVASQKLNADRSAHEQTRCTELLNDPTPFVIDVDELNGDSELSVPDDAVPKLENRGNPAGETLENRGNPARKALSKWQGFVSECEDRRTDASSEDEEVDGIRVTLERRSCTKRRKIDPVCKAVSQVGSKSTEPSVDDYQGRPQGRFPRNSQGRFPRHYRHVLAEVNPTSNGGVFSRRILGDSAVDSDLDLPSISFAAKENCPYSRSSDLPPTSSARSVFTSSRSTASVREPDTSTRLRDQTGRPLPPSAGPGTHARAQSLARAQPIPSSHASLRSDQIAAGTFKSGKESAFPRAREVGCSISSRWSMFLDDCHSHSDDDDDQLKACFRN